MYHRELHREGHTHRFVITPSEHQGWDVREERDTEVVRARNVLDWHRVERVRLMFSTEVAILRDAGWVERAC